MKKQESLVPYRGEKDISERYGRKKKIVTRIIKNTTMEYLKPKTKKSLDDVFKEMIKFQTIDASYEEFSKRDSVSDEQLIESEKNSLRNRMIERGNEFLSLKKYKKALDCYINLIEINDDYMGWYGMADTMAEKSMD